MFQHQGMWLPDGEAHFPEWMTKNGEIVEGRGTYQIKKWRACLPWIKEWRIAVDVGLHVGFWALAMARRFEFVYGFEPVAEFRECAHANLANERNVSVYPIALGESSGRVVMKIPELAGGIDSGGTHVAARADDAEPGAEIIPMRTLDDFNFETVDFLKIDCEGYEHHVLEGARATLEACRPCVIVEQKPHKLGPNFGIEGTPAVDILRGMGAHLRTVISGDYIMSWD